MCGRRWKAEYRLVPDEQPLIEAALKELVSNPYPEYAPSPLVLAFYKVIHTPNHLEESHSRVQTTIRSTFLNHP